MSVQSTLSFARTAYVLAHESISLALVLLLNDLKALRTI